MPTDDHLLTVAEVAKELGISDDGVRKLIRRGRLRASRRSAHQTRVSRLALAAYRAEINRPIEPMQVIYVDSLPDLLSDFVADAGMDPAAWTDRWRAGDFEDTAENMALLVRAVGLEAMLRDASVGSRSGTRDTVAAMAFTREQ